MRDIRTRNPTGVLLQGAMRDIRTRNPTGVHNQSQGTVSPGGTQKCDSELLQWLRVLWAISGQDKPC